MRIEADPGQSHEPLAAPEAKEGGFRGFRSLYCFCAGLQSAGPRVRFGRDSDRAADTMAGA